LRALATGVLTGALAIAGLAVMAHDARHVYHGLTSGYGLAAVIVSGLAGIGTFGLVWRSSFQLARLSAALAVAAVLAGWAAAQRPTVLPGLTLQQAAAARPTIIAVIVSVVAGGLILAPSLALLFRLVLAGTFDHSAPDHHAPDHNAPSLLSDDWPLPASRLPRGTYARLSAASLLVGFVLLTLSEGAVPHLFGVVALLAAAALGFAASASGDALEAPELARSEPEPR
jgi:cytochrome d ubiquinol oxidase subunit II